MSVVPLSKNDDPATACKEDLRMAYQEVCLSFHAIDDFRAKLLGFLPLASGAGIFLLLNGGFTAGTGQYLLPIGVFGFAITLGLFFYELRGIQQCNRLVRGGKNIEELLGIYGPFRCLPPRPCRGLISHTSAAYVIYPAVLAAWIFVALVNVVGLWASVIALVVLVSLFVIFVIFHVLDLEGEAKEEPNKSRVLGKMLEGITPDLQAEAGVKELKERLRKLSQEDCAPTQVEWQKLYQLTKNW